MKSINPRIPDSKNYLLTDLHIGILQTPLARFRADPSGVIGGKFISGIYLSWETFKYMFLRLLKGPSGINPSVI